MSGLPHASDGSSRGGISVALFVFCILGFLLAVVAEAAYRGSRLEGTQPADSFDPVPAVALRQPDAALAPNQVVEIQLAGLANPDISTGIRQCFAFASPSNRQTTGPLSRFAAMVRRPPYGVLMHRRLTLVGAPAIEGEKASVVVTLLDERDAVHVFQFLLSRQHGDGVEGCWMTDAVYPLEQTPREAAGDPATAGAEIRSAKGLLTWTRSARRGRVHG